MDNQRIEELVRMLERSQINVIDYKDGTVSIRVERFPQYPFSPGLAPGADAPSAAPAAAPPQPAQSADSPPSGPEYASITSPMVGVFHPLKKPIAMGDTVKKGTPVCVVEAMKLMNEIVSEEDGVVAWIAVKDGDMVEYGQMLMQIRRPVP